MAGWDCTWPNSILSSIFDRRQVEDEPEFYCNASQASGIFFTPLPQKRTFANIVERYMTGVCSLVLYKS
ncbi:unnamed protein product [Clavelina lepadiformis]|uniref:Uncharacterized protein n=1 Tax=Clavelina lepadiformis TaxID=159417 RepID=A0ABP0FLL4_CLALP